MHLMQIVHANVHAVRLAQIAIQMKQGRTTPRQTSLRKIRVKRKDVDKIAGL